MFVVNDDNSIYATRGDIVFFAVTAEDKGKNFKFQPGDVLRMKVYGKKDAENVVLQKDFPVSEITEKVYINLTGEDTKFGEVISKPRDYWYEVELNPDTEPQTIVGYDEDGAKLFKLFPEGDDIPPVMPKPEDIPVVDDELDMTSPRPVQNQVIARELINLRDECERTRDAVTELYVTPEMYGAIGDGVADDTEAIQAAMDAAGKKGGTIRLCGNYIISAPLLYKSNTRLLSEGGVLLYGDSVTVADKVMLKPYSSGVENVVIEGVAFDHKGDVYGNNGTSPCVSVNRAKNVTIRNCIFRNVQTMAVWFDDNVGDTESIKIIDNTIENGYAGGFSVFGYADGLIVTGNHIKNLCDDGIALQPGTQKNTLHPFNVVIANNVIENCTSSGASGSTPRGIISFSAENVTIKGNVIKNTLSCNIAVWCEYAVAGNKKELNVVISGNVCVNAGSGRTNTSTPADGIRVAGYSKTVRNAVVSDNLIVGAADNGIYLAGALFNVGNNTIKDVGQSGVMLTASSDCIICGNIVENAGNSGTNPVGIYLTGASLRNTVSNNRVFGEKTVRGTILQTAAENNQVVGNNYKGVSTSAVYDLGKNNDISGNITKSGNPLQIDYTIPVATKDFALTGISAITGGSVLVYPCNAAARTLLQHGFYVNAFDEQVDIHLSVAAEGTELIRVRVL